MSTGIRGEVKVNAKVDYFIDSNKFRQSSCGVQFFYSKYNWIRFICEIYFALAVYTVLSKSKFILVLSYFFNPCLLGNFYPWLKVHLAFFYFQLVLFHLVIKPFSFMALSRNWWLMMTQNTNGLTRLELLGLLMKHDRGFSPNFQVFDHICFSIWYLFFYYQFFF